MIPLGRVAENQLAALIDHYEGLGRPEATQALFAAMTAASIAIERDPAAGRPAPRPYPDLTHPGQLWTKAGRYWIAYRIEPLMIVAVFYDAANIPGRLPGDLIEG